MKKNILVLTLMLMTFLPFAAALDSLRDARIITRYLDAVKQHGTIFFSDPLVIQSVHELVDFCENNNQLSEQEKVALVDKVAEFILLIPADSSGDQLIHKSNPLSVNGQTLVAYWSQIFSSTYLLFDNTGNNTVALSAPLVLNDSYTLQFPISEGSAFQVLATTGGNPAQLTWITTVTNSTQLNLLNTATSADIINTLVLRDNTGSFIATNITTTGTLTVAAGSAASPSIQFSGSTNTGLSAGTANTLVLSTNGNQRFSIDPNGAATIAAPSAGTALTINGGTTTPTGLIVTTTGQFDQGLQFSTTPNNLGGNFLNAVGSYPELGLRMIVGRITTAGVINQGTGFTLTAGGTGIVTVNFTQAFRSIPIVTATAEGTITTGAAHYVIITTAPSTSSVGFTVVTQAGTAAVAGTFDFIAIGQA
jgi:hypothetical protein